MLRNSVVWFYVDGYRIPVIRYHEVVKQRTDWNGRPSSAPQGGIYRIIVRDIARWTNLLDAWAIHPTMMKECRLEELSFDGGKLKKTLEFLDTFCIHLQYNDKGDDEPFYVLVISAATVIRNGVVVISKKWRKTDPALRNQSITHEAEEPEEEENSNLLFGYGINKSDYISKIEVPIKIDDTKDALYATINKKGKLVVDISKDYIIINKNSNGSSIISDLSIDNAKIETWSTGQDTTEEVKVSIAVTDEKNKNDVFKVFKFAADNSNVEWSVGKIEYQGLGINYQIGTYHKDDLSPGIQNAKTGNPLGLIHSHPNQPTTRDRTESLFGDEFVGTSFIRKYGSNKPYLIYFPDNKSTVKVVPPRNPKRRRGTSVPSNKSKF